MKKYLSMILFIIILGIVASGILIGMNFLTEERIKDNQAIEFRETVLNTFEIDYDNSSINEVFSDKIQVTVINDISFYESQAGEVGFSFEGGGVWGPIIGFMVLEADFETIKNIAVLQQQETPGLGGVVAEDDYLETFVGVKVVPSLEINKDSSANKENEVDTITGATRTSKAFEGIINEAYAQFTSNWTEEN